MRNVSRVTHLKHYRYVSNLDKNDSQQLSIRCKRLNIPPMTHNGDRVGRPLTRAMNFADHAIKRGRSSTTSSIIPVDVTADLTRGTVLFVSTISS